jgi:hypothetical protein
MVNVQASQMQSQTTSNIGGRCETTNTSTRRANLRVKTLEIRWHDSKPISSCDFQPRPLKRARPIHQNLSTSGSAAGLGTTQNTSESCYKLATGGEDNNVRVSLYSINKHITNGSLSGLYYRYGWSIQTYRLQLRLKRSPESKDHLQILALLELSI